MPNQQMSVDELLEEQSHRAFRATVEAVEGKEGLVKITPWVPDVGCLCHLSIHIQKSSIESVTPTGETHNCCSKILRVVEVHFKKEEKISLEDLFAQLHASANIDTHTRHRAEMPHPWPDPAYDDDEAYAFDRRPPPPINRWERCQRALANCVVGCILDVEGRRGRYSRCECNCRNSYRECMGRRAISC